jgi:hypothetical protein
MGKKNTIDFSEELIEFLKFIVDNLKLFKITSNENELFILYDIKKNEFQKCNPRNLSGSILGRLAEKNIIFNKLKRRDMVDILIENNLITEVYDLGYDVSGENIYKYDDKFYFNTFKKGEFEQKYTKIKKNITNIDEGLKKFDFKNIKLLIRHLIGDERVFYQENISLLENKIKLSPEEEFDFKEVIDKIKTNNVSLIKSYFSQKLKELETDEKYLENINKKFSYFCKWFAFILQNPTFKLPNGLVFQSVPGVGKDRLVEWIIERIFGVNNIKSIGQDDLGKFNDFVKGVRFVICNEIEFSKANTNMYHILKRLMTDKHLAVQGKFKGIENIVNFAHFLFFGNAENIMKIEKGDRRFTVFKQDFKLPKTISKGLSPEMSPGILEKELEGFTQFLYQIKTNFEEIERPLITNEKEEIMEYHKSDIECFIDNMKEYPSLKSAIRNLTSKQEEIMYFSNFYNDELVPNDIVFKLFQLNNIHSQIRSNRQERSFQKALSIKGFTGSEVMWSQALGKNTRMRTLIELFPNSNTNNIIDEPINKEEITINVESREVSQ